MQPLRMKRKSVVIPQFSGDENMCVCGETLQRLASYTGKARPLIGSRTTGGAARPTLG